MDKIKVLFLASNPAGTQQLNLDVEARVITKKIRAAEHRDLLEFVTVWAVRPDDLLQVLNEHKPHIVHFSGHGNKIGEIALLDSNGQPKPVGTRAIKALFTTMKGNVRVVLLNACYSRQQAEAITEVIDCAIGMNSSIGDKAAIVFSASFYRAIGFNRSVQEAFDQANLALMLEGIPEETTPELLYRSGVNPSQVFPLLSTALPTMALMPERLRTLVELGGQFIDLTQFQNIPNVNLQTPNDYLFCELKMRETEGVFVFRAHKTMEIGEAAKHLVMQILPHLRHENYKWSLTYNDKVLPADHTFRTAGINSGDTVYLYGNHLRPEWCPSPHLRGLR
jgi:CHAT domain